MNLSIDLVGHWMSIDRQHCWLIVVGFKFLTDNTALSLREISYPIKHCYHATIIVRLRQRIMGVLLVAYYLYFILLLYFCCSSLLAVRCWVLLLIF
jgi:hypothetical protein